MAIKLDLFVLASLFLTPCFVILRHCIQAPSLFALHPACNAVAHLVLSPAAIYLMIERKSIADHKTRIRLVQTHWLLQLLALLTMAAGGTAAYMTKEQYGKPHFSSTHSWMAGAFGTLWFINYLGGATTTFLSKKVDWQWRNPGHRVGGIIAFAGMGATLASGVYSGSWGLSQLGADRQMKVAALIAAAHVGLFVKAVLAFGKKPKVQKKD